MGCPQMYLHAARKWSECRGPPLGASWHGPRVKRGGNVLVALPGPVPRRRGRRHPVPLLKRGRCREASAAMHGIDGGFDVPWEITIPERMPSAV